MKKIRLAFSVVILTLCFTAIIPAAYGTEAIVQSLGCVCQGGAELTATIREVGAAEADSFREQTLETVITAADGSLSQIFQYNTSLSLSVDSAASFAMLEDLNFDGYQDLCLLTAAGARNVFHVFALWNAETGRFDPIMENCPWIPDENSFAQESSPLELCCYQLLPETRQVVSEVADGYRYRSIVVYEWEGSRDLAEQSVATIFDAGDGMIGERLEMFETQIRFCWRESYPESWYYEQEGAFEERLSSLRAIMLGNALSHPVFMRVSSGTWVNLRLQDSTESEALAKLDAGTYVYVLCDQCGSENGWVRVWLLPQREYFDEGSVNEDGTARLWTEKDGVHPFGSRAAYIGLTGYIWHSFLEIIR